MSYRGLLPALSPETWNALTNSSSAAYHPLFGPLIVFEGGSNLAFLVYAFWLFWLFFKKSQRFPKHCIILLFLLAATQIIDLLLSSQIPAIASQTTNPENLGLAIRSIVNDAIWIAYFVKSKRVKNTFIKPVS